MVFRPLREESLADAKVNKQRQQGTYGAGRAFARRCAWTLWRDWNMKSLLALCILALPALCPASEPSTTKMGLFGQALGEVITSSEKRLIIGSVGDPMVVYALPVPSDSPIDIFSNFVIKADGKKI